MINQFAQLSSKEQEKNSTGYLTNVYYDIMAEHVQWKNWEQNTRKSEHISQKITDELSLFIRYVGTNWETRQYLQTRRCIPPIHLPLSKSTRNVSETVQVVWWRKCLLERQNATSTPPTLWANMNYMDGRNLHKQFQQFCEITLMNNIQLYLLSRRLLSRRNRCCVSTTNV